MLPDHITSTHCAAAGVERWLSICNWSGYEVSDLGRFRSYWKKGGPHHKELREVPRLACLKPQLSGHVVVYLSRPGSRARRAVGIHVLVLEAFEGPCPPGKECCHHPDPDPANNRLCNLRWDTRSENMRDRFRQGADGSAKLAAADIPVIWARLVAGDTSTSIARDHKVGVGAITLIKLRQTWRHVTDGLPGQPKVRDWSPGRPRLAKDEPPFRLEYRP